MDSLVVHEIYRSVQGESSFAGRPCTLVRLTGCNLRCRWCDTEHAFTGGTRLQVTEVLERALALQTPLVLITGGEPLLQAGVHPLMTALCDRGRTVMIETSGERDITPVDPRVIRVVDFKPPGSGLAERNRWQNVQSLRASDQVKFVLADRADYEWAVGRIAQYDLPSRVDEVLLSCVFGELEPSTLVEWVLQDALDVRVNLQLHKFIWSPDARSV